MNEILIEEAVTALSEASFDRVEFPYAFLMAFANKDTTIKRLRTEIPLKRIWLVAAQND